MSSFICKPETFKNVAKLVYCVNQKHPNPILRTLNDVNDLTVEIGKMNVQAYGQRYNEDDVEVEIEFFSELPKPEITAQDIKSAHCLLYQCEEGDVPKCLLFNLITECLEMAETETGLNLKSKEMENCYWG